MTRTVAATLTILLLTTVAATGATDGTWIYDGDGDWSDVTKWLNGLVADGADQTAYFTTQVGDWTEVTLDSDRTIGHLQFAKSMGWFLLASGPALTLQTTSGVPTITVNDYYAGMSAPIQGNQGFQKLGSAQLDLYGDSTYTGVTTISEGSVSVSSANALGASGSGNHTVVANGAFVHVSSTTDEDFIITGIGGGDGALVVSGDDTSILGDITLDGDAFISGPGNGKNPYINGNISLPDSAALTIRGEGGEEFDVYGTISGTGGMTFVGNGAALHAANTFTGDTVVNGGLRLENDNALQNSTVQLNQAGLHFGSDVLAPNLGGLAGSADLDLSQWDMQARTLTVGSNGQDTIYSGSLQGAGSSLVKTGTGTLTLTGDNTYTGVTTVSEGRIDARSANALGASGSGSHTVVADGASAVLYYDHDGTSSEDFILTGAGSGDGALILHGDQDLHILGGITLNGNATISGEGDPGTGHYIDGDISLPGSAVLTFGTGTRIGVSGTIEGTGGLTIEGFARLYVANTFSGDTVVNGALDLMNNDAVQDSTVRMNQPELYFDSTVLAPNLGGLAGSADLDLSQWGLARTLTVGSNGQDTTYSGSLQGDGSSLAKTGTGTLTLAGDNTYSGGTAVNDGILVAGHNNALGTGAVSLTGGTLQVAQGITISNSLSFGGIGGTLGGNGTYLGNLTVEAYGVVAPGNSPGLLTIGGDYTMDALATLEMELGGLLRGDEYDALVVTGTMSLAGTLDVTLWNGFDPIAGDRFDLLDWGTLSGTFGLINLPTLNGGLHWDAAQLYTTGTLSVSGNSQPVPAPGALLLGLFGTGIVGWLRRRR